MVYRYATRHIGQDCVTILVNGEEQVAAGCKSNSGNVLAVRKGEGVRLVPVSE